MSEKSGLSIRWKLALWNVLTFAFILIAFGVGVYQLLRQAHFFMLDKSLAHRVETLEASLDEGLSAVEAIQAWVAKFGQHTDYLAFVRDGNQNTVGATSGLSGDDITRLVPMMVNDYRGTIDDTKFGRLRYSSRECEPSYQPLRLYVLAELEHLDEELSLVQSTFFWLIPPTLLLSAVLSYWLAVRALAPVDQLRIKTDSITATDLHQRIPVSHEHDAIGQLTGTINALFARLEQAFDEIKRFTADASHELRTPLAIIRSEAEMALQLNEDRSRTSARLQSIVEECTRLTNLTDQLLSLSRAESAINKSTGGEVQLDGLLADVIDALEPFAKAASVQIQLPVSEKPCNVRGDYDSLRQVFHNLLDNAIKYNVPGGKVELRYSIQGQSVIVEVRDTGQGIAAEHLPRIFDRFFRVQGQGVDQKRNAVEQFTQGSGLGLSIVRRIVTNYGGKCEVESELGKGACFRVFIPID